MDLGSIGYVFHTPVSMGLFPFEKHYITTIGNVKVYFYMAIISHGNTMGEKVKILARIENLIKYNRI
jgi:hypothetical protein